MNSNKFTLFIFFLGILSTSSIVAQQTYPIDMLYHPQENLWNFSGAGGGNMVGLFNTTGAASGALALDLNFNLSEKVEDARNKVTTLMPYLKLNLFNNVSLDTFRNFDPRRLAFQDNDFTIAFGARFNRLSEFEKNSDVKPKKYASGFLDVIIVPYAVQTDLSSNDRGLAMTTVSINMGGRFGFVRRLGGGLWGISINPRANLLFVMDAEVSAGEVRPFEGALGLNINDPQVSRSYLGVGTKIEIPLNDFALSFDFCKYFGLGGEGATGLTDNVMFSIGGVATSSIFKNKAARKNKK